MKQKFDWTQYNESQTKEKVLFIKILHDLCQLIQEKTRSAGRMPIPTKDIIFAFVLKQYTQTSARRLQSDIEIFYEAGIMSKKLTFNTLLRNIAQPHIAEVLKELIRISSLPFKDIEQDFAIDSTGFGTHRYVTYFDVKHRKKARWKAYRKCHAVCGVKTNIITSVEVTDGYVPDSKHFEQLSNRTSREFKIRNFLADKGYLSKQAYTKIENMGGTAYIPFKNNSSFRAAQNGQSNAWKKMFMEFENNTEEFYKKYNKRSNIESCFSMIKRKFGTNVSCKTPTAQDNEIYARILTHNICVITKEIFNKTGIETDCIERIRRIKCKA